MKSEVRNQRSELATRYAWVGIRGGGDAVTPWSVDAPAHQKPPGSAGILPATAAVFPRGPRELRFSSYSQSTNMEAITTCAPPAHYENE